MVEFDMFKQHNIQKQITTKTQEVFIMKNTFKKIMASATAVTSLAVGMVGLSASAKELNEGVSFSVTTNTINETVVADDGTIIPIGSTAVTVSVTGNAGFDSSTTKLDIGTANVIVNNEGNPIYSVGDVLESSMVASAANDNFVAFSTASADEVCRDGDMFTFYISSGFAGVEIVDNERETFQPVNNAISPRGTLRSYMIGDVDQDNRIDASDASTILHAVSVYEDAFNDDVLPVNYANAHLSTYFPKASRAESADANKNDSITEKDASLVLQYYANASTGNTDPVAHVSEIVYYIE